LYFWAKFKQAGRMRNMGLDGGLRAAWNMKKFMKKLSEAFSFHFFRMVWQFLVHLTRQSQAFGTLSGHGNPAFLIDMGR
jgi:hypothetical protein